MSITVDDFLDRVIGHKDIDKPIHARQNKKAYCGFSGLRRLRDLNKIDEVTCPKCLNILKGK